MNEWYLLCTYKNEDEKDQKMAYYWQVYFKIKGKMVIFFGESIRNLKIREKFSMFKHQYFKTMFENQLL